MPSQYTQYKNKLKDYLEKYVIVVDGIEKKYSDATISESYKKFDAYYKQTDNAIMSYDFVIHWLVYGNEARYKETKADSWGDEFGQWIDKVKNNIDDIYKQIKDMGNKNPIGGIGDLDFDFGFDFGFGFDKLFPAELAGVLKESTKAMEAVPELLHGITDIVEDLPAIIKSVSGSSVSLINVLIQIFMNILVVIQRLTQGFVYFTQPMWLAFISVITVLAFLYKYRK